MGNEHSEHRKRVKQEFLQYGMEHFADHRVLELLLFYCVPRRDTNTTAHRLLERFGSLSGVVDAPFDLLVQVEGVGREAATYLKVVAGFMGRYRTDSAAVCAIQSSADAKEYMRDRFLGDGAERLLLVCLSASGKIIYSGELARGALEKVEVRPADVVKACLRANAVRAVLAHNHPGGFCNPSRADVNTTYVLGDELARVDVELFDHIIVAGDGVYSMRENGMYPGE